MNGRGWILMEGRQGRDEKGVYMYCVWFDERRRRILVEGKCKFTFS
jgi:hypothetical protein